MPLENMSLFLYTENIPNFEQNIRNERMNKYSFGFIYVIKNVIHFFQHEVNTYTLKMRTHIKTGLITYRQNMPAGINDKKKQTLDEY